MSTQTEPARQRPRPTFRTVQVRSVTQLTPRCVAITFGGDELRGFASKGPAEHIKVFFPGPGQEVPAVPDWGPNGPIIPPGSPKPISRTYTARRWDPDKNELEVHFMTYSTGPGATWAKGAQPGDIVVIAGPGRPFQPAPDAKRLLLAGDESALPALGTILEWLPADALADVYIEVANAEEKQQLASNAVVSLQWLYRSMEGEPPVGRLLADALLDLAQLTEYDAIWVACEADIMRMIRRRFLYERQVDRTSLVTRGYWKAGVANHPDHDMGEDV